MYLSFGLLKCFVFISEVSVLCDVGNLFYENAIKHAYFLLVHDLIGFFFIFEVNLRNFREELDGFDSGARWANQISQHLFDQLSLKNITKRDPGQEGLESFEALSD